MKENKEIYIITGATGGIGREISRAVARAGKNVVLACRNEKKALELAKEITSETQNKNITFIPLSLDKPESVKAFAARIKELGVPVKALVNNAGIMCKDYTTTDDGREMTFAVNYTGTVMLSVLIAPLMVKGGHIVFTTSLTRYASPKAVTSIDESQEQFAQLRTYSRSKSALTHFAMYMAHCYTSLNINCADPGVVDSDMITMHRWYDPLATLFFRPLIRSPRKGAVPALKCLTLNTSGNIVTYHSVKDVPYKYIHDSRHGHLMQMTRELLAKYDVSL